MTAPLQVPLSLPLGDVRGNKTLRVLMPRTRAECVNGQRPCQHVSCRHHLLGDIVNHAHWDTTAQEAFDRRNEAGCNETCALDIADRGEASDEEIARVFGIPVERVQQIADEANRSARLLVADHERIEATAALRDLDGGRL